MEETDIKDRGLSVASIQYDDGDIYIRKYDDCVLINTPQAKELIKILTEFINLTPAK